MTATLPEVLPAGVHADLDEARYHAAGGLSYSGAKVLLDCPARYRWQRDHGRAPKREWDLGHVAHRYLLGKGSAIAVIDAPDWRTKSAQTERDEARAAGRVPILRHEDDAALRMADAVMDSQAGPLFAVGDPEVSMSWVDEQTGVPLRGRVDWLHPNAIVDLKTCANASPDAIQRDAYKFGYWLQWAAYTQAAAACGLGNLPMIFVFVEVDRPHIVTPVQPDDDAIAYGQRRWREAIDVYDACTQADNWPAYAADIQTISLPAWVR